MAIRVKAAYLAARGLLPATALDAPVRIVLPYPPSVNHYFRMGVVRGKPRVFTSGRGLRYCGGVAEAVARAGLTSPLTCPLAVTIDAFPPDAQRRDADNLLKAALDACTKAALWADDGQVRRLVVTMRPPCAPGRLEVEVSAWPEDG